LEWKQIVVFRRAGISVQIIREGKYVHEMFAEACVLSREEPCHEG
jgi:hypothetical protein